MKSFTFFVLVLLIHPVFSQVVKKPCMLLFNDSTRQYGFIDFNDWTQSPRRILFFKDSNTHQGIRYNIDEIQYFEIEGHDAYQRIPFYNACTYIPPRLQQQPQLEKRLRSEQVFALLLVSGPYALARYTHDEHDHFLFYWQRTDWEELRHTNVFNEDGKLIEHETVFRSQLLPYVAKGQFTDEQRAGLVRSIENLHVDQLPDIVHAFNAGKSLYAQKDKGPTGIFLFFGGAPGFSQVQFSDRMKLVSAPTASAHLGFDVRCSQYNNGVLARISFDLNNYFYPQLHVRSYGYGASLSYSVLLRGVNRLYAGGGFSICEPLLSKAAKQFLRDKYVYMFEQSWTYCYLRMGFIWRQQWEIALVKELISTHNIPMTKRVNPNNIHIQFIKHMDLAQLRKRLRHSRVQ